MRDYSLVKAVQNIVVVTEFFVFAFFGFNQKEKMKRRTRARIRGPLRVCIYIHIEYKILMKLLELTEWRLWRLREVRAPRIRYCTQHNGFMVLETNIFQKRVKT